jgi:hypothetical protein
MRAVHDPCVEGEGDVAVRVDRDQSRVALDRFDHLTAGVGQRQAAELDQRGDAVRGGGADQELPVAGGRHGDAVVRPGPGADQRRVADPARALSARAAGRGGGGEPAVVVQRDRADGPARLPPALALAVGDEPVGAHALDVLFSSQPLGARAGQHHVRRRLHYRAGKRDCVARRRDRGHRAGAPVVAAHERGVHLDRSVGGENRAAARVELRCVLERLDGLLRGVQGGPAVAQDRVGALDRGAQRVVVVLLAGDRIAARVAAAAVYDDRAHSASRRSRVTSGRARKRIGRRLVPTPGETNRWRPSSTWWPFV